MTCLDGVTADILQPVRKRYDAARKDVASHEEGSVYYKAKEGMLSGLDEDGCLQSAQGNGMICWDCFGYLKYDKVPTKALVNGTWPGLVPPELQDLSNIEISMISIYNNICILKMLPSGVYYFVILNQSIVLILSSLFASGRW